MEKISLLIEPVRKTLKRFFFKSLDGGEGAKKSRFMDESWIKMSETYKKCPKISHGLFFSRRIFPYGKKPDYYNG